MISMKLTKYVYPQLRKNPFFGTNIKKLKGYDPATWRYRIGKFRVFFKELCPRMLTNWHE